MRPLDVADDIAEQAASWIVLLDSEDEAERIQARQGFAAWKAQSPQHAEAAARLQAFIGQVQQARGTGFEGARAAHAALDTTSIGARQGRSRRAVARAATVLAAVLVLAVPSWQAMHSHPPANLLADLRSSSGEWSTHTLADGSKVTLSGVSAINWHMDDGQRVVELVRGRILVDVAKDAARPFYVQTPVGRVRAIGTRFTVTYGDDGMTLEMLESRVALQTPDQWKASTRDALVVQAGQRVHVGSEGVGAVEAMNPSGVEEGWRQHQLLVDDRPLPEVLDQLARHHAGPLYFDRTALAHLRVSGVLPLDDTARALQLLQQNFPLLRMRSLASHWVWLDLQPAS